MVSYPESFGAAEEVQPFILKILPRVKLHHKWSKTS